MIFSIIFSRSSNVTWDVCFFFLVPCVFFPFFSFFTWTFSSTVAVGDAEDFATVVEGALAYVHREIRLHAALQKVLATEPDRLLRFMTREDARILDAVVAYSRPRLDVEVAAGRVRPGVDLDEATRFVATMGLSLMATPGRFDLEDPEVVHHLVQSELLGGILLPG